MPQAKVTSINLSTLLTDPKFRLGYEHAADAIVDDAIAPWPYEYEAMTLRQQGRYELGRLFAVSTWGKFRGLLPKTVKELRGKVDMLQGYCIKNYKLYQTDYIF